MQSPESCWLNPLFTVIAPDLVEALKDEATKRERISRQENAGRWLGGLPRWRYAVVLS